jgi:hypothetical protein
MDKVIRTFRSKSLSGARKDEMTTPVVAEQVIACVRHHAGTASTSTVVGALVEEQISETEIMKALRWLLQNGDLRMGATMNLELVE